MKLKFWLLALLTSFSMTAFAAEDNNILDELNPYDPNVEEILRAYDEDYQRETGLSPFLADPLDGILDIASGCRRATCSVWAKVVKAEQKMYLHLNGQLIGTYATSTGMPGHGTPNFDTHPDGRIYYAYTSRKWPGGDYNGLGNMPYAVFIRGGFAIHGTGKGNWKRLGTRASHGCIRVHPDNGKIFNSLVRQYGIKNTWITVY